MGKSINSDETIHDYLLGRVSDETTLEELEERLFADEDFCSRVALAEDSLINDFVFGNLSDADAESFRATLRSNPERSFKLELTQALRAKALAGTAQTAEAKPSFFASLIAFFRQPMYVGALAAVIIAVVGLTIYFNRKDRPDDQIAELQAIYSDARPTESRLSEFGYAPLSQLRGGPATSDKTADKNRLRLIENNLIQATEEFPNAETHHALGVFKLTQQQYEDAIGEFTAALKAGGNSARLHNDLGAAHFELAKTGSKEKRLEHLSQSLEEFTQATKLDSNFLPALFNLALARQELNMPREAREAWNLYLQKDPSSPWADEARKNLTQIDAEQTRSQNEEVLGDFLTAYRNHDDATAQKIHHQTKGLLKTDGLALQLSRRFLNAKQSRDEAEAQESLAALAYIGKFEEQDSEFFFLS